MGDELIMGDLVEMPAPRTGLKEKFFYAKDTGQLYVTDGISWIEVVTANSPLLVPAAAVPTGVGDNLISGLTPFASATAGQTTQILNPGSTPNEIATTIVNPNDDVDLWVNAVIQGGSYRINTGAYVERLEWEAQWVNAGASVNLPILTVQGGRDGEGAEAISGTHYMNFGQTEAGFLLPGGASETVSMQGTFSLADDGTLGVYSVTTLAQPTVSYIGVPLV